MATPVTVPMVGKIVSVSVKAGDRVEEDDQIIVITVYSFYFGGKL